MSEIDPATHRDAPDGPFPGLTYYTAEYAKLFFGRDVELGRIIGNLRVSRLTLLYAQSGVGKSSLLSAGVAPTLRNLATQEVAEDGTAGYVPVVFRTWAGEPVPALIGEIETAIGPFLVDQDKPAEQLTGDLATDDLATACELAAAATDSTLLLILDQFEEYFNYHPTGGGQGSFPDQLAACINRPDLRVNVLIAIRDDAYARIGDLLKGRIPSVYGNYLHLDHLKARALHDSISKAVSEFNRLYAPENPVTLDPGLVERVLEQVSAATASQTSGDDGSGASTDTAFVQLVMKRLWDEEQAAGSRTLHLATLERLGGATTIIGTHLDTSMAKLSEEEQDVAASAFRFLVTPERAKIALGTKALSDWTGIDEAKLESVLGALSMPDLRILRPVVLGGRGDRHRFEIFHDGLAEPILSWRGRYEQIELEQERAAKEVAQREASESAAREEHERKRRRQYARAAGVFLTAFLASLVVLAFYYRAQTSKEKDNNLSIRIAERVATLTSAPNFGPGAAALASIEAYRLSPTVQARNGELSYLQENPDLPKIGVGHSRSVSSVTFVPGSQILASASYDGTVRFWDANGHTVGTPVVAPTNSTVGLTSIVASTGTPKLLAVGRDDGGVDVWSLADETKPKHLETLFVSDGARVNAVTFSPDGRYLVAGDGNGGLTGWDTSTLLSGNAKAASAFKRTIDGEVNALQYCPDSAPKEAHGVLAVATSADGWLWKPVVGSTGPTAKAYSHPALSAACSADGTIAFGVDDTSDPGILISPWSGKLRYIETSDVMQSLAFTDGGKTLVSGGSDWMITTWDVATGRSFGAPMSMGAFNTANGVAVSEDGRTIAAAGDGDQIKIWRTHIKAPLARIIGSLQETECCIRSRSFGTGPTIMQLAVGGNGQIATATTLGVALWRAKPAAGTEIPEPLTTIPSSYSPIAYYGNLLAVADGNGFALWNTAAPCNHGAVLPTSCRLGITNLPSSANGATILDFDRTGKILSESTVGGGTQLWDVSNPRSPKLFSSLPQEPQSIDGVAFSPLADLLAIGGNDGTLKVWDVSDPRHPRLSIDIPGAHEGLPVSAMAFSPTKSVLATGGEDQQVRIWSVDPAAATMSARLTQTAEFGQTNTIEALAFSPDGRVLASGDGDGSTCLYDVDLVRTIGSSDCLLGHGSQHGLYFSGVPTAEFLPDGSALLTAGQDNPLVSWDSSLWSPRGNEIEAPICESAGSELDSLQWSEAFSGTPLAGRRKPVCAPSPG